jgi:DNA-binding MarR family transcriptional regulator
MTIDETATTREACNDDGVPPAEGSWPDELHLAPAELRAWRSFLEAHARVFAHLEAELVSRTGTSLADYDVLFQLAVAEDRRLRMRELADRVLLSRSGLTRLVDRLEASGLVARMPCPQDARGSFAVLTDRGLHRVREVTPVHLDGVRRTFLAALDDGDLAPLAVRLERVAELAAHRTSS